MGANSERETSNLPNYNEQYKKEVNELKNPSFTKVEEFINGNGDQNTEIFDILSNYINNNITGETYFGPGMSFNIDDQKISIVADGLGNQAGHINILKENNDGSFSEYNVSIGDVVGSFILKIREGKGLGENDPNRETIKTIVALKDEPGQIKDMLLPIFERIKSMKEHKEKEIKILGKKYASENKVNEETGKETDNLANEMLA